MVDEIANSTPTTAASPATPVEAVAPVVTTASVPAAVETPAIATEIPAPVIVEPVKVDAPVADAKKPETLLAQQKPEDKPIEVKAEEKPAEVKVEDVPIEAPKYELTLPEGFQVDEAKLGDFTKMLGDFETTAKVPHEEMQKLGQQMIERHLDAMKEYTESLTNAWNKQADDWKNSFMKDPEFSNRTDTVLQAAGNAIKTFAGDSKQQTEFYELMESSKIGNHPAMIRLLANVMLAKGEGKPLAAPQIATTVKSSKLEKMYGKKNGN